MSRPVLHEDNNGAVLRMIEPLCRHKAAPLDRQHEDANHKSEHHKRERHSQGGVQKIAQAFLCSRIEHDLLHFPGRPKLADPGTLSCPFGDGGKVFASEVKKFCQVVKRR